MHSGTPKPSKQQVAVAFPVPSPTWAKATKKGRTSDARLSAGLRYSNRSVQCKSMPFGECMSACLCRFLSLHHHYPNIHDVRQIPWACLPGHTRSEKDKAAIARPQKQSTRLLSLPFPRQIPYKSNNTITVHAFGMTNKFTNHQSTRFLSIRANRQRLTSNCDWPKHWWSRNTGDCSPATRMSNKTEHVEKWLLKHLSLKSWFQ